MHRQLMIPFHQVQEQNINCNLEWDDNYCEQEIVDKILNSDFIEFGNTSLIIEHPKLNGEEWHI